MRSQKTTSEPSGSHWSARETIYYENRESDVMTTKEVAEHLKLAEKAAHRLSAEGEIPGFMVGASWRFRRSEIDRWIIAQEKWRT